MEYVRCESAQPRVELHAASGALAEGAGTSGEVSTMKLDAAEKGLLESVARGEWKSAARKRERTTYARYAKATFRKDRRLSIRLSSKDLEAIQKRALAEGIPYRTLISSLLHKYASGRLKEV